MSKISRKLKQTIVGLARQSVVPAPKNITSIYKSIQSEAQKQGNVSRKEWLAIAAAATITMNSPDALTKLWMTLHGDRAPPTKDDFPALESDPLAAAVETSDNRGDSIPLGPHVRDVSRRTGDNEGLKQVSQWVSEAILDAQIIREVGLKSISFNGIPKTINTLTAFRTNLPEWVTEKWRTAPLRPTLRPFDLELKYKHVGRSREAFESLKTLKERGNTLWNSVYGGVSEQLIAKLGQAHPDMPGIIISTHYGCALADPTGAERLPWSMDRWMTSVVAIACLRAQGGAGPQVLSHVFGLRNAADEVRGGKLQLHHDGKEKLGNDIEGRLWLASDDGATWLLQSVDRIVDAFEQAGPSSKTSKAKL